MGTNGKCLQKRAAKFRCLFNVNEKRRKEKSKLRQISFLFFFVVLWSDSVVGGEWESFVSSPSRFAVSRLVEQQNSNPTVTNSKGSGKRNRNEEKKTKIDRKEKRIFKNMLASSGVFFFFFLSCLSQIEDSVDMLQVDFANKRIGGGVLGRVKKC